MDAYYTNPQVAISLSKYIKKYINIDYENDFIIEPSAGSGAFIKPINELCKNRIFIDIQPGNKNILEMDYLDYNYNGSFNKVHIIGNPPFGKRCSMAIKFIKKSCEFCDTFSFILPNSFNKKSIQNSIPYNFHLLFSINLPKHSFIYEGNDVDVPCIFQIWIKKENLREKIQKIDANGFQFVDKKNADISIRRVGYYAGKISKNIDDKNENTHYFIKFDKKNEIIDIGDIKIKSRTYTTGPYSITKNDVIKYLNKRNK